MTGLPALMLLTDPDAIMRMHDPSDVAPVRESLIRLLWRDKGFPSWGPAVVEQGVNLPAYMLPNVLRHDRIVCSFDGEPLLDSTVDVLWPIARNDGAVIYCGGHTGDTEPTGTQTLGYLAPLVAAGYVTVRVSMPLLGANYVSPSGQAEINYPGVGWLAETNHNNLRYWGSLPHLRHPLALFAEPTVVALNYVLPNLPPHPRVGMFGYSGGGWTTLLVSALDTRINRSYPVAGFLPHHLRLPSETGDWEQFDWEWMRHASYLDLCLLASVGYGRRCVQINNEFDPSVFAGAARPATYVDAVKARLAQIGPGSFDFVCDPHNQHTISPTAMSYILSDLAA